MDQKKKDYEMINDLWSLLRDYGDLTNSQDDEARWREYIDKSMDLRRKHPEARRLFIDLDIMLERRSVATNQGDLKIAC